MNGRYKSDAGGTVRTLVRGLAVQHDRRFVKGDWSDRRDLFCGSPDLDSVSRAAKAARIKEIRKAIWGEIAGRPVEAYDRDGRKLLARYPSVEAASRALRSAGCRKAFANRIRSVIASGARLAGRRWAYVEGAGK